MKTKAISSIFVLFAIAAGMASMAPAAFADHSEVTIGAADNSGIPTDCNVVGQIRQHQIVTLQVLKQLMSVVL